MIESAGEMMARSSVHLLDGRRIKEFMFQCGLLEIERCKMWRHLVRLQSAIYALDCFGENNWYIDGDALEIIWSKIDLVCGTIGNWSAIDRGLSYVRQYQEIEIGIRRGAEIGALEIGQFYAKKKCDVALSRLIVTSAAGIDSDAGLLSAAWAQFDLVSEVLDDISDLPEDCRTFNGNRLLSAGLRQDIRFVCAEYCDFLSDLRRDAYEQLYYAMHEDFSERNAAGVFRRVIRESERGLQLLRRDLLSELPAALRIVERLVA